MGQVKTCFVIAPIGELESDIRKRSDQVLKHVIKPAVEECEYKAVRADEIDKPGIITSQVLQRVVNDGLVIADLTDRNPNVFYELAIRHAARKPFVQLMQKGEQLPFDVAATRTIFVDHHDLDSVDEARTKIIDQVKELEQDSSDIETPLSLSLDLQLLRESEKPEDRSLADLVAALSNIRSGLGKIETKIDVLDNDHKLSSIQQAIRRLSHTRGVQVGVLGQTSTHRLGRTSMARFDELVHLASKGSPEVQLIVLASFCRELLPWVHELAMECYRLLKSKSTNKARSTFDDLRRVLRASLHDDWAEALIWRDNEELLMQLRHLEHRLMRTIEEYSS